MGCARAPFVLCAHASTHHVVRERHAVALALHADLAVHLPLVGVQVLQVHAVLMTAACQATLEHKQRGLRAAQAKGPQRQALGAAIWHPRGWPRSSARGTCGGYEAQDSIKYSHVNGVPEHVSA